MFGLILSFLAISFADAISTEWYYKPRWRRTGWDSWKKQYNLRTVILFGCWYFLFFWLSGWSWLLLIFQVLLHIAGWEDFMYALWCPLFQPSSFTWEGLEVQKFFFFEFPTTWPWLGKHNTSYWKWTTNWWLVALGGPDVKFSGMLISLGISVLICLILTF